MNGAASLSSSIPMLFSKSPRVRRGDSGYILIEVLVAMTIFAITGGVLIHSLMNAFEATRTLRDMTKALYLTKVMLHDLEIRYTRRADVQLGEFEGNYPYPGSYKFRWYADIEYDRDKDAYIISVRTKWEDDQSSRRRRGRWQGRDSGGVMLKTMVLTARYNEELVLGFGGEPNIGRRGEDRSQGRQGGQRGGQRGGRSR
ncbi:MAG: prepilin-type N-terminal cleavage/methylation domain-containing protein [Candidatus Omnitrophica bacterium]|nr:prepilin-type N-terminal cleavage/methylation domain-containing protein [Candidatus Omnitrophota bacterium]